MDFFLVGVIVIVSYFAYKKYREKHLVSKVRSVTERKTEAFIKSSTQTVYQATKRPYIRYLIFWTLYT